MEFDASYEDQVTILTKNGKITGIAIFNGHTSIYRLQEPLGRQDFNAYVNALAQPPHPLTKIKKDI